MPYNTDGKYGNLIMQDCILPATHSTPEAIAAYEKFGKRIHWVDSNNTPGAFQMNTSWYFKPNREYLLADPKSQVAQEHKHDYPELVGFYGSDPENPTDLGGEVEFYIDGEQHILTKSTLMFLPGGLPHCPMFVNRVDRPIFHFSVVMNQTYTFEGEDGEFEAK